MTEACSWYCPECFGTSASHKPDCSQRLALSEADRAAIREAAASIPPETIIATFGAVWLAGKLSGRAEAIAEAARLRDALTELVACKDLHDALNDSMAHDGVEFSVATVALRDEYLRRKPDAWSTARRALG